MSIHVSVVTPVYNEPRVGRALCSISHQRGDVDIQTIVVDGGSMDRTPDVLAEHQNLIDVLISEPDDGLYDAMNKGIDRASGEIVGILNADDRYRDENVLADVERAFEDSGAGVVYGDLLMVSNEGNVVRRWKSGDFDRAKIRRGWFPPHPSVFVRREVYDDHGGYDTDFRLAADVEFMMRVLWRERVEVAYLDRPLVEMTVGGKSTGSISAVIEGNLEVSRACRRHGLGWGILIPILKPARKMLQFVRR